MAKNKKIKPVSIWGIEFDAMIEEQKTLSSTIPSYPVEDGFPVSDTIINNPVSLQMTLYLSNTPVTWFHHGVSNNRVSKVCELIENKWTEKKLTKIVTSDTIYTNMGITSLTIRKSKETGYSREITVSAQKVWTTQKKTVSIPAGIMKSGTTMAAAGKASASGSSSKAGSSGGSGSGSSGSGSGGNTGGSSTGSGGSGGGSGGSGGSGGGSAAKKSQSILYGVASGLGFI